MKEFIRANGFTLLFFFLHHSDLSPQTDSAKFDLPGSLLEMRSGDLLEENYLMDFYSMTRFIHNYPASSLESWTSPGTGICIEGIPFSIMPLNINSLDFLPLDLLQAGEFNLIQHSGIEERNNSRSGSIDFKIKEIEDSFTVHYRGYLGSETGDPLIHTFTRVNTPAININKIPLSGAASFSIGSPDLRYRFTLGYYGHFSSGSVNDQIMSFRNPRFYSKLDKKVLASGELLMNLSADRKIKLTSSFMSYYGWDIPPFTGTVIHFESYLYLIRADAENVLRGFSFAVNSQGSINEINGMTGIPPSKFHLMENSFAAKWIPASSGKLNLTLIPEISLYSIRNISAGDFPLRQNFFTEEFDKPGFAATGIIEYKFTESLSGYLNLKADKHFSGNSAFSAKGVLTKKIDQTALIFSAGSEARFPTASDITGKFRLYEYDEADTNEYIIEGNRYLTEERLNFFGIKITSSLKNLSGSADFFFGSLENPIIQKTTGIKRTKYPGDIIRSALYINSNQKKNFVITVSSKYSISEFLIKNSYMFIENSETDFFPRHKFSGSLQYNFSPGGSLIIDWFYRSSSVAEEFILSGGRDELLHTGFDGKIPGYSYLNLSVRQEISPFYFMNDFSFKISIENIFDRKLKFFPIGNETGRTVVLYVSGGI